MRKIRSKIYNTLRWSEKYTKTDMIYLAKGGSWLTLGQIVSSASVLLLSIAFANLLPKETYGTYKYILSIASILAIPTLSGMNTAITQAIARGYEGSFIVALKMKIRWGLLGALSSLVLAGYYYINGNNTLTISFLIVAVFTPFFDSFNLYSTLLNGRKLFNISTKYHIISQTIAIASMLVTVILSKNLFVILLTYFIPWILLYFIFLKITLKKFPPNQKRDPKTISYGKHLSLINILGTAASHIDKILLFHYLGAAEVAIYVFAIAIPDQMKGLFKNIPTLVLPKLAYRSFDEINTVLYKRLLQLSLLGILITVIYILIAPYFFKIFFPKYIESVFFSQIFIITIILKLPLAFFSAVTQSKLTLIPKTMLYWVNILPPIVLIISLLLLTGPFGILGVIASRIILLAFSLVVTLILWKKLMKINHI